MLSASPNLNFPLSCSRYVTEGIFGLSRLGVGVSPLPFSLHQTTTAA